MRSKDASNNSKLETNGVTDIVSACRVEIWSKIIATILVGHTVPSIGEVTQP